MVPQWRCPLCAQGLQDDGRSLRCAHGHCFDKAKEGYVNLLPANRKRSRNPGDSAAMLNARRSFLETGHYQPLVAELTQTIARHGPEGASVLDCGCGEGFYIRQLQIALPTLSFLGIDISRDGVKMAARLAGDVPFAVASARDLPIDDASVDVLLRVFAPANHEEERRVLKPDGVRVVVSPGPMHLFNLKSMIYDTPKAHPSAGPDTSAFSVLDEVLVAGTLALRSRVEVGNLLAMTPYFWRASAAVQKSLAATEAMDLQYEFRVSIERTTPSQEPTEDRAPLDDPCGRVTDQDGRP